MNIKIKKSLLSIMLISMLNVLYGCQPKPDSDLKNFVRATQENTSTHIDPLPPFKKVDTLHYTSKHLKNPFDPLEISLVQSTTTPQRNCRLDPERPRELLESYPIESLRMIGYIEKNNIFWGLLLDANNNVHRVKEGNYLGLNEGIIEKIHTKGIEIHEWNSMDGEKFQEKTIFLPLSEPGES